MSKIDLPEVHAALIRKGWRMWQLAAALGVGQSTLSGWIHGRASAPDDLATRVEDALGVARGALASKPNVTPAA